MGVPPDGSNDENEYDLYQTLWEKYRWVILVSVFVLCLLAYYSFQIGSSTKKKFVLQTRKEKKALPSWGYDLGD